MEPAPPQSRPLAGSYAARVAEEIRAEMARRHAHASDLATFLGLSRQRLRVRLDGKQAFTIAELDAVAGWLDMTIVELLLRVEANDAA